MLLIVNIHGFYFLELYSVGFCFNPNGTETQAYASFFLVLSPELTPRRENCDPGPTTGLSVCLCSPAQELIPTLRKLDRLLEAAEKL